MCLATAATEDAQRAGSAPNCAQKFRGENFDTKLKNEIFPTKLSPDKIIPPPPVRRAPKNDLVGCGTQKTAKLVVTVGLLLPFFVGMCCAGGH